MAPDNDIHAPQPLEEDLDELQEEIEEAEEIHDDVQGRPEGQLYVESGTIRPDLDDQTITPPG
jgi:hypothetical protein